MSADSRPQNIRLPELDGLRALAILMVLVSHHFLNVPIAGVSAFVARGWIGVDLFFVLSGFLIGGILMDARNAENYYRLFYLRRFLRIVPLYALLVLPGLAILAFGLQSHFAGHSLGSQSMDGLWLYPFFLQNVATVIGLGAPAYLGPTWSLAVEEQFYLLLPPLVRKFTPKKLLVILLLAIGFAPLVRCALLYLFHESAALATYIMLPCRWDSLLLGVLVAFGLRTPGWREMWERNLAKLQAIWWFSFVVAIGFLATSADHLAIPLASVGYTFIDFFFACTLLLAVIHRGGSLNRFLSLPAFKPIAATSYGLYLIQSPMMAVTESICRKAHIPFENPGWSGTAVAMVSLTGTFIAAAISWKFFESWMIRLGHQSQYTINKN
jgi:peptidoglycan/LPS O-acetylase OafA/YrhL